jgi:hypothetical protein
MAQKVEFTLTLVDNVSKIVDSIKNSSKNAFEAIGKSVKTLDSSINGLNLSLGVLGSSATLKKILDSKNELDKLKISLNTTLGSDVGKPLFDSLIKVQEGTQLSREAFIQEAIALDGFGVSSEKITDTLSRLSDVSLGSEGAFRSLSEAMGKVSINGALGNRELMAMRKSGFDPLFEISKKTGESMSSLSERMKNGAITFKEVDAALISATSAGGRFYQSSEKIASFVGERFNTQLGRIPLILAKVGDALESKFSKTIGFIEKLTDKLLANETSFAKIVPIVFNFVSVISLAALAVKAFALASSALGAIAASPLILVGTSVALLVSYLIEAVAWTDKLKDIFDAFKFDGFIDGIMKIGELILEVVVKSLLKVAEVIVDVFDYFLPSSVLSGVRKAIESAQSFFPDAKDSYVSTMEQVIAAPVKNFGARNNLEEEEFAAKNGISGGGIKQFNINIGELNGLKANTVSTTASSPKEFAQMAVNELVKQVSQFGF